jgi:hypothetical protein
VLVIIRDTEEKVLIRNRGNFEQSASPARAKAPQRRRFESKAEAVMSPHPHPEHCNQLASCQQHQQHGDTDSIKTAGIMDYLTGEPNAQQQQ